MTKKPDLGFVKPYGIRPLALMELLLGEGPTVNRMLDEIEIECLAQGGKNNGQIIHTYSDFVRNGTSRKHVKLGMRRLEWLGIIKIKWGRPGVGKYERSNQFELTYRPTWIRAKRKWVPATNLWLSQLKKNTTQKSSPVVVRHRLCRPAGNETVLDLPRRRHRGRSSIGA